MDHDAWFFVGIFAFIFLIWVATGGPTHPIAFGGPSLAQPQELGGGTYLSLPRAPFAIGGNDVSLPGSTIGGGSISGTGLPAIAGTTFGTPSTYRGAITLTHSVYGAGASNPDNEYLELSVPQNAGVPVDITGWTIMSDATGAGSVIPQGTEVVSSGIVNPVQDIVLEPGQRALLISGQSPIGGSFRENKCIGYFSSFQKFTPQLPQNCPAPSDELSSLYGTGYIRDAACIDYVNTLSRCQVALSPPVSVSGACQTFLIKYLNYNGCVDQHRSDADFFGNTWRVYLGRTASIWRTQHEVVKLLDKQGNTVDAFSY